MGLADRVRRMRDEKQTLRWPEDAEAPRNGGHDAAEPDPPATPLRTPPLTPPASAPDPSVPARTAARRLKEVLVLAVPAPYTPRELRVVRVLSSGSSWFYEIVDPSHADPAVIEYARSVLGQVRGDTPPERVRETVVGRRVEAAMTIAVPDPLADGGIRVVRVLRGGDDWCYEVVAADALAADVRTFVQSVVRELEA